MGPPVPDASGFPPAEIVRLPDRGGGPVSLAVHRSGEGPAVIFSHGFPELGYSWRHQLPAVAAAGFCAVAPDQRGYGASDAPAAVEAYAIDELCGDLVGICDHLGVDRAVFVGHDWGGSVIWALPTLHPERVAGLVGVCTPFGPFPTTEVFAGLVDGDRERHYVLWFQEPGVAEATLDPRARLLFERTMRSGVDPAHLLDVVVRDGRLDMNPFRDLEGLEPLGEPVASPPELERYVTTFERTGFGGGINWYRNIDENARRHPAIATADPGVPCLMICAEWDPVLPPAMAASMVDKIADLEMVTVPRAGHWVTQERPAEVNDALLAWLTARFRT